MRLVNLIFLLILATGTLAEEICEVDLRSQENNIHVSVQKCTNIGTFSIGALYRDRWEKLTYNYPRPWEGTFLSIKVNNRVYCNSKDVGGAIFMDPYVIEGPRIKENEIITRWRLPENLIVEEVLELIANGTRIYIILKNENEGDLYVGARLHIDTMLGENDGAPIYIPGDGLRSKEKVYSGKVLNFDYWKAFNREENASVIAKGILNGINLTYPDKFIVAYWKKSMYSAWDYEIDPERSILLDSAVILYYEPIKLEGGGVRVIGTSYMSGESILPKGVKFGIVEVVPDKLNAVYCPGDVAKISVDLISKGSEGKGYIEFSVTDENDSVIYKKIKETGIISRDSVETISFEFKIPDGVGNTTINTNAVLFDENDERVDEKSLKILTNTNICPRKTGFEFNLNLLFILLPVVIIAGIVLVIMLLQKYLPRGNVEITKIREDDHVRVIVWNKTNKSLENCVIEDRIPEGAEIKVITMNVIRRETKLIFNVGRLESGERAILEYRIKGFDTLPSARVIWDSGEKVSE